MAIEAPTDDYKGTYASAEAGKYHVIFRDFDEDGGDKGEAIATYEIVTGTTPGQEGCLHKDYMSKSGKAFGRFHALAIALGITTDDEVKSRKERGESAVYEFTEAIGKHLFIILEDDEYQGKAKVKLGYSDMFHPSSPKVRTWPRNEKAMKAAGHDIGAAVEAAKPAPKKGSSEKPPASLDGVF